MSAAISPALAPFLFFVGPLVLIVGVPLALTFWGWHKDDR